MIDNILTIGRPINTFHNLHNLHFEQGLRDRTTQTDKTIKTWMKVKCQGEQPDLGDSLGHKTQDNQKESM